MGLGIEALGLVILGVGFWFCPPLSGHQHLSTWDFTGVFLALPRMVLHVSNESCPDTSPEHALGGPAGSGFHTLIGPK